MCIRDRSKSGFIVVKISRAIRSVENIYYLKVGFQVTVKTLSCCKPIHAVGAIIGRKPSVDVDWHVVY